MKLIEFSTRRPVSVFILAVAAVVFGIVALGKLATDLLPDVTYPSLTVRTELDGAAPIEVESLITRPIENAVGVVNGVTRVTSSSRADVSEVTLEFGWDTNMDLAGLDVRERLDVLVLPQETERPVLLRYDPSLDPIQRIGLYGEEDLVRLRLVAEEDVRRALERVEGVAAVVVSGGLEEEIQVEIDERRLANRGLEVDLLLTRLAEENVNLTGGRLREGQSEYLVRTVNEYLRPEDLANIVIDSSQGAIVRLSDVARVYKGHRERQILTRIDGRESVEVAVYKEGGTNTVTVSDAVAEEIEELVERLGAIDPNLRMTVITDQARFIRQSIREVLRTATYGGLLAVLVLFFFLRSWKTTFIIGAAIPISVIATFFLMFVSGISLNIMSLGGLTLGVGLLVDNSIVVLEAIERRRDRGRGDLEAAEQGASEVGRAVVASTLTTICVFLPIVFVEGVAGQLFRDQALTVTFSLAISLLVALTVIPMLASRHYRAESTPEPSHRSGWSGATGRAIGGVSLSVFVGLGRVLIWLSKALDRLVRLVLAIPLKLFEVAYEGLERLYLRLLGGVLRRPLPTVGLTLLLLVASLLLVPGLGRELVPELIQGEFFVDTELPPGTHLDVTQSRMAVLERAAMKLAGARTTYAIIGTSNEQGGVSGELRENLSQLTVTLESPYSRRDEEAMMAELRLTLDRESELDYRFGRPSYFSFKTPVEIEIRGFNLALLERLADQVVAGMRRIDGLVDIKASTDQGDPGLRGRQVLDRGRLSGAADPLQSRAAGEPRSLSGRCRGDRARQDPGHGGDGHPARGPDDRYPPARWGGLSRQRRGPAQPVDPPGGQDVDPPVGSGIDRRGRRAGRDSARRR